MSDHVGTPEIPGDEAAIDLNNADLPPPDFDYKKARYSLRKWAIVLWITFLINTGICLVAIITYDYLLVVCIALPLLCIIYLWVPKPLLAAIIMTSSMIAIPFCGFVIVYDGIGIFTTPNDDPDLWKPIVATAAGITSLIILIVDIIGVSNIRLYILPDMNFLPLKSNDTINLFVLREGNHQEIEKGDKGKSIVVGVKGMGTHIEKSYDSAPAVAQPASAFVPKDG